MKPTAEALIEEAYKRGRKAGREEAARELAPCKTAGTVPVVAAVATGSLPGWAVDILAESWHVSAIFEGNKHVRATLDRCLKELRAAQARANKRQPEENTEVSRGA